MLTEFDFAAWYAPASLLSRLESCADAHIVFSVCVDARVQSKPAAPADIVANKPTAAITFARYRMVVLSVVPSHGIQRAVTSSVSALPSMQATETSRDAGAYRPINADFRQRSLAAVDHASFSRHEHASCVGLYRGCDGCSPQLRQLLP
jgi:hypothetical protein